MMNLADALAHHVRARPDRPAIVQGDRVWRQDSNSGRIAAPS